MEKPIRTFHPPKKARLIFIGDIHGCYDELLMLLETVAPSPSDVVVSVGDIVNKGPRVVECLELWRARGYVAVRGNNETKVLDTATPLLRFFRTKNREVLRRGDLVDFIHSWPLVADFPDQRIAAVHGGLLPGMRVTEEDVARHAGDIDHLRWVRRENGSWRAIPRSRKRPTDVLWSEVWAGDRFVVYGHTPLREPKRDQRALGLDTGCVYGRSLTAAVWKAGEWSIVSVPAKHKYAD